MYFFLTIHDGRQLSPFPSLTVWRVSVRYSFYPPICLSLLNSFCDCILSGFCEIWLVRTDFITVFNGERQDPPGISGYVRFVTSMVV